MLDPLYERCVYQDPSLGPLSDFSADVYNENNVRAFNPLETLGLVEGTPRSFFEMLSIILKFQPIHKSRLVSSLSFTFVDLDPTEGVIMALQGLYPKSNCYSLLKEVGNRLPTVSKISFDIDLDARSKTGGGINLDSTSPEGLAALCRWNNPRGVTLAYCQDMGSMEDTLPCVVAAISCLATEFGTLCMKVQDYTSSLTKGVWELLETKFSSIELYKPGTMSCVRKEAVIVCTGKLRGRGEKRGELMRKIRVLEEYRAFAIRSVHSGKDNQQSCDITAYLIEYLNH